MASTLAETTLTHGDSCLINGPCGKGRKCHICFEQNNPFLRRLICVPVGRRGTCKTNRQGELWEINFTEAHSHDSCTTSLLEKLTWLAERISSHAWAFRDHVFLFYCLCSGWEMPEEHRGTCITSQLNVTMIRNSRPTRARLITESGRLGKGGGKVILRKKGLFSKKIIPLFTGIAQFSFIKICWFIPQKVFQFRNWGFSWKKKSFHFFTNEAKESSRELEKNIFFKMRPGAIDTHTHTPVLASMRCGFHQQLQGFLEVVLRSCVIV